MNLYQSESIGKVSAALVKAQSTMGVAIKDATNPHFKSKYADLASIINAARDPLADNGLAVVQRSHPNDRGVQLQTTIVHESGEWISDAGLFLPAAKVDPQGFGSAMTYARRYSYAAMLGIVQDDDDGARAVAQQQAARIAADAPKLDALQLECLELVSAACGHAGRDRSDALAEDYAQLAKASIQYAVKQNVVEVADAPALEAAMLAANPFDVTNELAGVTA